MMNDVLIYVQHWLEHYGYLGLFSTVFVESFGIPAPGQSSLMASALMARADQMNIVWVLITAWAAAFSGDTLGYLIGLRWGKKVLSRLPVSQSMIERIEKSYLRYGGLVIIFGRFIEGFRQINGIAAGSLGMPLKWFLLCNAIGALLWCSVWGLALYFAANTIMHAWETIALSNNEIIFAAGVLLSSIICFIVYRSPRCKANIE